MATTPSFFSMSVSGSFGFGGRPRPLLIGISGLMDFSGPKRLTGISLNFEPRRNLNGISEVVAYKVYEF